MWVIEAAPCSRPGLDWPQLPAYADRCPRAAPPRQARRVSPNTCVRPSCCTQSTGGRLPFSSGTLTIRPGPGSSTAPTILDTAMLHGLASFRVNPRALSGSARIVVEDIIIVNMCVLTSVLGLKRTASLLQPNPLQRVGHVCGFVEHTVPPAPWITAGATRGFQSTSAPTRGGTAHVSKNLLRAGYHQMAHCFASDAIIKLSSGRPWMCDA